MPLYMYPENPEGNRRLYMNMEYVSDTARTARTRTRNPVPSQVRADSTRPRTDYSDGRKDYYYAGRIFSD